MVVNMSISIVLYALIGMSFVFPSLATVKESENKAAIVSEHIYVPPTTFEAEAVNILEAKSYPHHPVIKAVHQRAYPIRKGEILELNGLRIPAKFDCDILSDNKHWGNDFYFYEVPTRWHACYIQKAHELSGINMFVPFLPLVDDEYCEQVAVYQSVLRADPKLGFVVAELGARWGTWGSRAVTMLRESNPMEYSVYFVEANTGNCEGLQQVMEMNDIKYHLDCEYADAKKFTDFASLQSHVDLIDLDIQGAELKFLQETRALLDSKVYRLIIGTHSIEIHKKVKEMFKDWIHIHEAPYSISECHAVTSKYLRGNYKPTSTDRFGWDKIISSGCFFETPFGKVNQWDGELVFDNPKFVIAANAFSMSDKVLKINDLYSKNPDFVVAANTSSSLADKVVKINDSYSKSSLDRIIIGAVSCGQHGLSYLPSFLGSIARNPSFKNVYLHLLLDEFNFEHIPPCIKNADWIKIFHIGLHNETDGSVTNKGRYQCATWKLAMDKVVMEDKILVLDLDMVILEDLMNLWNVWSSHDSLFLATREVEARTGKSWYENQSKEHPKTRFYGATGLNSGVLMINLKLKREKNVTVEYMIKLHAGTKAKPMLQDQDFLNAYGYYNKNDITVLDCRWNRRTDSKCTRSSSNQGIFHGNRNVFLKFPNSTESVQHRESKTFWESYCINNNSTNLIN
jgi:lipopolysaccharide biosynthesis glycosyltransferase